MTTDLGSKYCSNPSGPFSRPMPERFINDGIDVRHRSDWDFRKHGARARIFVVLDICSFERLIARI